MPESVERRVASRQAVAVAVLFAGIDALFELVAPDAAEPARFVMLAGTVAALAALHIVPASRAHWVLRAAIVTAIGVILFETVRAAPTVPSASPLALLGVVPFFVILVGGLPSVIAAGALCLVGIAWASRNVRFEGRLVSVSLSNIALTAIVGMACAAIHEVNARRLRRLANEYATERRRELELAQTLSGLLFSEFRSPLDRIRELLADSKAPDRQRIASEAATLREIVARGRAKVLERKPAAALSTIDVREEVLRAPVVLPLLLTIALAATISFVRNVGLGPGPVAPLVVLVIALLGFIAGRRKPNPPRRILAAVTIVFSVLLLVAHRAWGFASDSPTLVTQPALTFVAYSIAGPLAATGVALLVAIDIFIITSHGVPLRTAVEAASTVVTASWFALASCWLYWRALRLEIASVERSARAYDDATRHRYRLVTTFFHDEGNLLMPLGLIAGTQQHVPDADATLREIVDRMIALLDAVQSIYENENLIEDEREVAISVGRVFEGIELLFGERIREKRQRLVLEGDRGLLVHAMPAVLVDSVLSNLVSNAIKFTPEGGTVRISASVASPERVALSVRDDGPGIPQELVARLERADRLPSTEGTAGEPGHGFGLVLAKDFARRMGGRLRIGRPLGSGAEVIVDFPAAVAPAM